MPVISAAAILIGAFFTKALMTASVPGAEADLGIAGDDGLHVLAAAAREDRVDVDVVFSVEAFFLGDVNRQRDGKQYPMRHHDDDFGARRGGPRGRRDRGDRTNSAPISPVATFVSPLRVVSSSLASLHVFAPIV